MELAGMREPDEPLKVVKRASRTGDLRLGPKPRYSPSLAMAASLLAVLGFSFGLYQHQQYQRLQTLSSPRATDVVVLFPEGETLRGGGEEDALLPADTPATLILPSFEEPEAFSSYEVVIEGDRNHWRLPATRGPDGEINLLFPVGLPEGDYEIHTFGIRDDTRQELGSYKISARLRGP
jgi:hypothetical protein